MSGRRRATVVLTGLAAVWCLAACSSDPPTPTTTTSAQSSSTSATTTTTSGTSGTTSTTGTSSTPTALNQIPEAARTDTAQGAESFIGYWIDQLNSAMSKADTTILPSISSPDCKSCESYNSIIQKMDANQQHFDGVWLTPTSIAATKFIPGSATVQVSMRQGGQIVSSSGSPVTTAPVKSGEGVFTLSYTDQWRVSEVQYVQP